MAFAAWSALLVLFPIVILAWTPCSSSSSLSRSRSWIKWIVGLCVSVLSSVSASNFISTLPLALRWSKAASLSLEVASSTNVLRSLSNSLNLVAPESTPWALMFRLAPTIIPPSFVSVAGSRPLTAPWSPFSPCSPLGPTSPRWPLLVNAK